MARILKRSCPCGASTSVTSPLRRPMSARPSGDSAEMRPAAGSASSDPTTSYSSRAPVSRSRRRTRSPRSTTPLPASGSATWAAAEPLFEPGDPRLEQRLLLARSQVVGVRGRVRVGRDRLTQALRDFLPAGRPQTIELVRQSLEATRGDHGLLHRSSFIAGPVEGRGAARSRRRLPVARCGHHRVASPSSRRSETESQPLPGMRGHASTEWGLAPIAPTSVRGDARGCMHGTIVCGVSDPAEARAATPARGCPCRAARAATRARARHRRTRAQVEHDGTEKPGQGGIEETLEAIAREIGDAEARVVLGEPGRRACASRGRGRSGRDRPRLARTRRARPPAALHARAGARGRDCRAGADRSPGDARAQRATAGTGRSGRTALELDAAILRDGLLTATAALACLRDQRGAARRRDARARAVTGDGSTARSRSSSRSTSSSFCW